MIKGKISVQPQAFASAVRWAAKFIAGRPAVPVQAGLRLETEGGRLYVASMNESVSAVASVACDGDGHGVTVVSGRLLDMLAGTFPAKAEVVIAGDDENSVTVTAGRWSGTLPTMSENDYPDAPEAPPFIGHVSGDGFAQAVSQVAAATASDPKKLIQWRLVHLEFAVDRAMLIGTDGLRVAGTVTAYQGLPGAALVLAEVLTDVAAGFAGPDQIKVGLAGDSRLSLASATRSVVIGGIGRDQYNAEQYAGIIAHNNPEHAIVRRPDLTGPFKRAAAMLDKDGPVAVRFAPGVMTLAASAGDLNKRGADEVDIEYGGPEVTFYLNPEYFGDALASAPGDLVDIALTDAERRPGIPNPIVMTVAGTPWRHVLMPIRPPR